MRWALATCRSIRRLRVSMPCRIRKALWGEIAGPEVAQQLHPQLDRVGASLPSASQ
jgi:hypothetical protein